MLSLSLAYGTFHEFPPLKLSLKANLIGLMLCCSIILVFTFLALFYLLRLESKIHCCRSALKVNCHSIFSFYFPVTVFTFKIGIKDSLL